MANYCIEIRLQSQSTALHIFMKEGELPISTNGRPGYINLLDDIQ